MARYIAVNLQLCGQNACTDIEQGKCDWRKCVYRRYSIPTDNVGTICDTLGGWRQRNYAFPLDTKYIIYWVDQADRSGDVNLDNVKVALFTNDYCTGEPIENTEFDAWFGNAQSGHDGRWVLQQSDPVKSIRPYYVGGKSTVTKPSANTLGIKIALFPYAHMYPYDQLTCNNQGWRNLHLRYYGWPNDCASGVDRIYCLTPNTVGAADSLSVFDFADSYVGTVKQYWNVGYPLGSIYIGSFDSVWNNNQHSACDERVKESMDPKSCLYIRFWSSSCPQSWSDTSSFLTLKLTKDDILRGSCYNTKGRTRNDPEQGICADTYVSNGFAPSLTKCIWSQIRQC